MGKMSTGKKRGIQQGIAKHKIGSKAGKGSGGERLVLGTRETVYFSIGRKCFEFWFYCCCRLYLTPFTRTANGEYVPRDRKGKLLHYTAWFLKSLMLLHKLWGLGTILLQEELKIETFICACQFLFYHMSISVSLVMFVKPKETMDLLNSWPHILSCLKQVGDNVPSQYDELSEAFKLLSLLAATQGAALGGPMCSLMFSNLPTCYLPTAEKLGLIPEGLLPRFAWQLLFYPLEFATYLLPSLCTPLAGSMFLILLGVFRIYLNELR